MKEVKEKKLYRNRDFLYREYVEKKKPCTRIAKEQHTNYKQILYWIHKHNLPLHPHFEYYRVNLIGRRFGSLIVIGEFKGNLEGDTTTKGIKWDCRCDCGRRIVTWGRFLTKGDKTSCGCHRFKGYKEISGVHFSRIKRQAKSRNKSFNVTLPQIWDLFISQNRKCALSGVELFADMNPMNKESTASLDRIDSSKGYTLDNIQWVHKDINRCKWHFSENDFLGWVKKIHDYRFGP